MLYNLRDEKTGITYVICADSIAEATKFIPNPNDTIIVSSIENDKLKKGLIFKLVPVEQLPKKEE